VRAKGVYSLGCVLMRFINQLSSQLGTGKKQTHETRNGQRKNTGNNANYLIIFWASIPWPCKYVLRGNVNKLKQI